MKAMTNRSTKATKNNRINILEKMLEDKKAIRECIRKGGDLKKTAKDRNVRFVTPI